MRNYRENILISVIIPVYNVELYLKKCLDSVLKQNFIGYELILVDDGSTDNSGRICDIYREKDERVIVLHKENGGLSDARNKGINAAKGKYITFIDSDDYVDENYLTYLFNMIVEYKADMSICTIVRTNEHERNCHNNNDEIVLIMDASRAIELSLYQKYIDVSACGKLYKRSLFENIRFPVSKIYEDLDTTYKLYGECDRIVFGNKERYYYVERPNSITGETFSDNDFVPIRIMDELYRSVIHKYEGLENACIRRKCIIYVEIIKKAFKTEARNRKQVKHLREVLRITSKHVLVDKKTSIKDKIKILLAVFCPQFYSLQAWVVKTKMLLKIKTTV